MSDYQIHLTRKSNNAKTGKIPVTTTTRATCPDTCPLKGNGCYADNYHLSMHWDKVTRGERGGTLQELCNAVEAFSDGQLWRHNQAGDLPGDGRRIDAAALGELTRANTGKRGFTYTHYLPDNADNAAAIAGANAAGFTVNLSANDLQQADTLAACNIAPVVVLLPGDVHGNVKGITTPQGRRVIVCPATYRKDTTCASCGLCANQRRPIIGFPAHGTGAHKASDVARGA